MKIKLSDKSAKPLRLRGEYNENLLSEVRYR